MRHKPAIPEIPSSAVLVDLRDAARILSERSGQGWSYSSLRRLLERDWGSYEGRIWVDRSTTGKNRRIKIYIDGVLNWLRLPVDQR